MLAQAAFYTLAAVAVLAGAVLVISRNLFHAVLGLAVASLAVAGLMLTLGAEFLALVLILIYVGAVVVLGVFAVMLTGHFDRPGSPTSNDLAAVAAVVSAALIAVVSAVVVLQPMPKSAGIQAISVNTLGTLLMTRYVLPFELVSFLLLAALIGALVIAGHPADAAEGAAGRMPAPAERPARGTKDESC